MIPIAAISEALALLPPGMGSREARVMLVAIGLQESRFKYRRQLVGKPAQPVGPATGFWQFEKNGGVKGVLTHASTSKIARGLCDVRGVAAEPLAVWDALQRDDVLAAGFARLLLWTDPKPLPRIGDAHAAWALYLRLWRPGKPHPETWPALYADAVRAV